MRGKYIFFAFGVGIGAFVKLLTYLLTPTNWGPLSSALQTLEGFLAILILTIAAILVLVAALLMMNKEDRREQAEQVTMLKAALKEALEEDTQPAAG